MKKWILLVVVGMVAVIVWMSKNKAVGVTAVSKTEPKNRVEKVEDKNYEDEILSFRYPGDYDLRREDEAIKILGGMGSSVLWVISKKLWNQSLGDEASVIMRRVKKDVYLEEEAMVDGVRGIMFTGKEQWEKVIFIKKNNDIFTIAITAAEVNQDHEEEWEKILGSWEWK